MKVFQIDWIPKGRQRRHYQCFDEESIVIICSRIQPGDEIYISRSEDD
jgi:hypothetical protein